MARAAHAPRPKHTLDWIVDNKVLPRLDALDEGQKRIEDKVTKAGLNGHTELLKEFLDEQAARKESRLARHRVTADFERSLAWLSRPKALGTTALKTLIVGLISAYAWGLLYGKIQFPFYIHP
jgi:hypothetical protein